MFHEDEEVHGGLFLSQERRRETTVGEDSVTEYIPEARARDRTKGRGIKYHNNHVTNTYLRTYELCINLFTYLWSDVV